MILTLLLNLGCHWFFRIYHNVQMTVTAMIILFWLYTSIICSKLERLTDFTMKNLLILSNILFKSTRVVEICLQVSNKHVSFSCSGILYFLISIKQSTTIHRCVMASTIAVNLRRHYLPCMHTHTNGDLTCLKTFNTTQPFCRLPVNNCRVSSNVGHDNTIRLGK